MARCVVCLNTCKLAAKCLQFMCVCSQTLDPHSLLFCDSKGCAVVSLSLCIVLVCSEGGTPTQDRGAGLSGVVSACSTIRSQPLHLTFLFTLICYCIQMVFGSKGRATKGDSVMKVFPNLTWYQQQVEQSPVLLSEVVE